MEFAKVNASKIQNINLPNNFQDPFKYRFPLNN